jgi:hypothetical protein
MEERKAGTRQWQWLRGHARHQVPGQMNQTMMMMMSTGLKKAV